jgi:hypothetical protein
VSVVDVFAMSDTQTSLDTFQPADAVKVYFGCLQRGIKIVGLLASELEIGVDSKWNTLMGGSAAPIPGSALNAIDMGDQLVTGHSIRQPWFSRGVWLGNSPTQIPLTISFYAVDDPKAEVWDQVLNVIKLMLPMKLGAGSSLLTDGINAGVGAINKQVAAVLSEIVGEYAVPGPTPLYPMGKDTDHVMFCYIGSLAELSYSACYFTGLKVKFPSGFGPEGYPLAATVNFTVNSLDSMYLDENGSLKTSMSGAVLSAYNKAAADQKKLEAQQAKAVNDAMLAAAGLLTTGTSP